MVTGHGFLGNDGTYSWMELSSCILPRSTSCITAVAVIGLEMDPRRISVSGVTGTMFSRSAMPYPAAQLRPFAALMATETPGIVLRDISVLMVCSISRIFSVASVVGCAKSIDWTATAAAIGRILMPSRLQQQRAQVFVCARI